MVNGISVLILALRKIPYADPPDGLVDQAD